MKRVQSGKRSFKKSALGAMALSSTTLLSTVAIAAGTSTTFLVYNSLSSSTSVAGISPVKWLDMISLLTVATVPSSSTTQSSSTLTNGAVETVKPVGVLDGLAPMPAMKIGINLNGPEYWSPNRSFMNLVTGSTWTLVGLDGKWVSMPGARLDANRNVVSLEPKEVAARQLSVPTAALRGASVDIICRWKGSAKVGLLGGMVRNLRLSSQSLTFTFVPQGLSSATLMVSQINPDDPIRNIDCRETDADPNALYHPLYLENVKRYSTIRFLKWTRAVESNITVTWANRTKPGDGIVNGPDSIPVEYMVALANQTKTNPWFTIPWNADDDYVRRFAEYVRDNLDPNLTAYVENSNEVWNYQYKVTKQALEEGKAGGLTMDDFGILLRRYGEKTGQVMDIWSSVFTGKMNRIVRVAATQNNAWAAGVILGYKGTASKVDALATAPYMNVTLKAGQLADPARVDSFFSSMMASVEKRIAEAKANKDVATKYGLRYITYEAGQHALSPDDLDQMVLIQRDPRMGKLYTNYLTQWKDKVGDLMVLFADYGTVSKYGAWGQSEYIGQPLSEAPKENAVELFRQSYLL
jgi:hypothetical protein